MKFRVVGKRCRRQRVLEDSSSRADLGRVGRNHKKSDLFLFSALKGETQWRLSFSSLLDGDFARATDEPDIVGRKIGDCDRGME